MSEISEIINGSVSPIRAEYISLLSSIDEKRGDVFALIKYLDSTNFFHSPATIKYHHSYDEGLCKHCIDVYKVMKKLNEVFNTEYSDDSLIIVSLCHEFYKINMFSECVVNEKIYSLNGSKYDSLGKFDWVSHNSYKLNDANDRVCYGSDGFTSYMIVSEYLALSTEESEALVNYLITESFETNNIRVLANSSLTALLHCADILCSTSKELIEKEETDEQNS